MITELIAAVGRRSSYWSQLLVAQQLLVAAVGLTGDSAAGYCSKSMDAML
jgi:hypothetical protein